MSLLLNERVHDVSRNLLAQLFADRLVIPKHGHQFLPPLLYDFFHGLRGIELRFLLQQSHGVAFGEGDFSRVIFVDATDNAQQGAFAGAVRAEHANFGPVIEGQVNVLQHLPLRRMHPAHANQRKNNLLVARCHMLLVRLGRKKPGRKHTTRFLVTSDVICGKSAPNAC